MAGGEDITRELRMARSVRSVHPEPLQASGS